MRTRTLVEKFTFFCSVIGLGLSLAGTRACQENYTVAGQVQSTPSGTETGTVTPEATDTETSGDIVTRTPTVAPTATTAAGTTPTVTPTVTSTGVSSITSQQIQNPLLSSLAALGTKTAEESKVVVAAGGVAAQAPVDGNWLGKAFSKDGDSNVVGSGAEAAHDPIDADGDGYSDWVEEKFGADPESAQSRPAIPLTTNLVDAMSAANPKLDVAAMQEQLSTGGAAKLHDSDGDGLPDDYELEVGSDPLSQDTDGDGIWDAREVELGSVPTRREWR